MKDVAIVVTTFERPEFVLECVKGIRRFYPDVKIIVSDNGKKRAGLERMLRESFKCDYIGLPFDCGASRARNEGFKMSDTKYTVLCEDDFRFTEKTKLENFKTALDSDESLGIIGGVCVKNGSNGIIGSIFTFDEEKEIFYRDPIRLPKLEIAGNVKYFYCDYIRMFFMARNIPGLCFFDEDFKAGGNHTSGLIELKKKGEWKLAFTYDVEVTHWHSGSSQEYKALRYRRRMDWNLFYEKTGYRYGIFDKKRVRDYRDKVTMSYDKFTEKMERGEI